MQRAFNQQWIKDVCLHNAQKDKTESVARAMVGFLKPNELAQFIVSRPLRVEMHAVRLLDGKLGELHSGNLQQLARKYDPCGRLVAAFARRRRVVACRSVPATPKNQSEALATRCKYSSCSELNALLQPQPAAPRGDGLSYLLLFFVKILVELASRRQNDCLHADCAAQLLSRVAEKATQKDSLAPGRRRTVRRPVACQAKLVAAITDDGCLQTWDSHGGREAECEPTSPTQPNCRFSLFREMGVTVLSLACGAEHTVAITTDGVYGWGSSRFGQLGIGTVQSADVPTRIPEFCCVDIACGHYHTMAITEDGRLWAWGLGTQGQLGTGACDDIALPTMVTALASLRVIAATGGQAHSLVLTSEGDVYAFGCSSYGQLGTGDTGAMQPWPTPVVALDEPVRLVATHSFHSVAVTVSNVLYSWGVSPQLLEEAARSLQASRDLRMDGSCDYETVSCFLTAHSKPRKVSAPFADTIVQVSCTALHTLALTSAGQLYAWSCDVTRSQRLRAGGPAAVATSRHGDTPSPKNPEEEAPAVNYVACGPDFCVALDEQGRLLAWGKGSWLASKQDKDVAAADGHLLPPACVLFDPVADGAQRRSSPPNTYHGLLRNESQRLDPDSESSILDFSGYAAYNLHLIPCAAKLLGCAFPMTAAQATVAKQGALDVIAALLLVQGQYQKAFHYHLEALLSCKHHTTSGFARAFTSTVDVYRRLALVTGTGRSGKQDLYHQLLAKAAAFASSHGMNAVELLQLRPAVAPSTPGVPSTRPISPSAALADSPSPEPDDRRAVTFGINKRLATVPQPAMPVKRSRMAAEAEQAQSTGLDRGRHDHACHPETTPLPLVPKAQPTSIVARLRCSRPPARLRPPSPWQPAYQLPDTTARDEERDADKRHHSCAEERPCSEPEAAAGYHCATATATATVTAAVLAKAQSAADEDDMPTDLSMKGRHGERPGSAEAAVAPAAAGTAAAAAAATPCSRSHDTVEFCCGHSFVRHVFVSTVLPRFLVTASRNTALGSCSRMMIDMYQRTDICALACPDCVASAVGRL